MQECRNHLGIFWMQASFDRSLKLDYRHSVSLAVSGKVEVELPVVRANGYSLQESAVTHSVTGSIIGVVHCALL